MALETSTYIVGLVATNPDGSDQRNTADDHIRLIKAALKRTFPQLDGAVSLSHTQLMLLNDVSASVQLQLNQLRDGSATANAALVARYANSASYAALAAQATLALTANSASYAVLASQATLALTANSASYATIAGTASFATSATSATNATSANFATTAGSASTATTATTASNANAVNGYTASQAATGSTVAVRTAAGYLLATYFNQSSSPETNTPDNVIVTMSDDYFRKISLANFGANISGRNISNKSGTSKTLQSGSGPPSLSGSTNGDLFYYF